MSNTNCLSRVDRQFPDYSPSGVFKYSSKLSTMGSSFTKKSLKEILLMREVKRAKIKTENGRTG